MPHSNALSLVSLEGPDFLCKLDENSVLYTTIPFGVVVSNLDFHQADRGSNSITS